MRAERARGWPVALMLVAVGACGGPGATDPAVEDEVTSPFEPGDPPPESGQDFHLVFDGTDDRVLVPWDASFPTDVFTAVAWIRMMPPGGRAAIIASRSRSGSTRREESRRRRWVCSETCSHSSRKAARRSATRWK